MGRGSRGRVQNGVGGEVGFGDEKGKDVCPGLFLEFNFPVVVIVALLLLLLQNCLLLKLSLLRLVLCFCFCC